MKTLPRRIYDISIWFWMVGLAALLLAGGVAAKNWKVKPTENGEKCLSDAKRMVAAELSAAYDRVLARIMKGYDLPADSAELESKMVRDKRELERLQRAYTKSITRLKEEEFLNLESSAIEGWVSEGRERMKNLPKTERSLRVNVERSDKEWEIFMERDMVDLLDG